MKSAILAVAVLALFATAGAVAQDQDRHDQQVSSHHVRKTTASGYVRRDGDNYVLEDDKDKQHYRIQNSETVREHEGHHVKVNARLHEDDHSLEVNKIRRLPEGDDRSR